MDVALEQEFQLQVEQLQAVGVTIRLWTNTLLIAKLIWLIATFP